MSFITHKPNTGQNTKKKPPPRPPPPNFSKYKSKSTYNLNENLIEWSPPNSPKAERNHNFGGSVSSSFSSSTSSLASSKKSFEYDIPMSNNIWPTTINPTSNSLYTKGINKQRTNNMPFGNIFPSNQSSSKQQLSTQFYIPPGSGPTIIRPHPPKTKIIKEPVEADPPSPPLPMPSIPPPSPPKDIDNVDIPYGIALYDFEAREPNDLSFQANDIILLMKKINDEWYYGRLQDREGIFPANFIDVIVPLVDKNDTVMALYEFSAQMVGDLPLKPGQLVKVTKKINDGWLYGESHGQVGQFPSNFVNRIPNL